MIRPLVLAGFVALSLAPAFAQDVPATPPAGADITIDPAAALDKPSKSVDLLTGFYATKATIDICSVAVEPGIQAGLDADQRRLEQSLGLDPARAAEAYVKVRADVEKTTPDCADGSPDRLGVDALLAIYKAQAAASPGGAGAVNATPPAADGAAVPVETPAAPTP